MAQDLVIMDVGSDESVAFNVADYIVTYFGIPKVDNTAMTPILVTRNGYTAVRKALNADDTAGGTSYTVGSSKYYRVPSTGGTIAGKKIIVPTKKQTAKGNLRLVTIRVPASAAILPIIKWVYGWTVVANRPEWVRMETGKIYPVRNYTVTDVNPGNDTTPPPA